MDFVKEALKQNKHCERAQKKQKMDAQPARTAVKSGVARIRKSAKEEEFAGKLVQQLL